MLTLVDNWNTERIWLSSGEVHLFGFSAVIDSSIVGQLLGMIPRNIATALVKKLTTCLFIACDIDAFKCDVGENCF